MLTDRRNRLDRKEGPGWRQPRRTRKNPSPLTLGALAYLVLFFPVVLLGRWIETRFAWKR
jgi:ABC-type amino acid transport system permease subunit